MNFGRLGRFDGTEGAYDGSCQRDSSLFDYIILYKTKASKAFAFEVNMILL